MLKQNLLIFIFLSLVLLHFTKNYKVVYEIQEVDSKLKDIYVYPTKYSHSLCNCKQNTWGTIPNNNIPGILPGPVPGDRLGLENDPRLSLF